jgi:hypothetical protein
MSRRVELIVYGVVACVQVLAWLALSHTTHRMLPAAPGYSQAAPAGQGPSRAPGHP